MTLRIGAMFPTREVPPTREAIEEWVSAVVDAGVDHIVLADHVLGVDPEGRPDFAEQWPHAKDFRTQPFTHRDPFHEPMVLMGFLAAICDLDLATGVLILPQRQAVLVAKQAAEIDVLLRGQLRLVGGVGWNRIEYEALGVPFERRGARIEEQMEVMRLLWARDVVNYHGEFHRIDHAGLQIIPGAGSIPIWLGGDAAPVLDRIGRVGDGWYTDGRDGPDGAFDAKVKLIHEAAHLAGRDVQAIGIEPRIALKRRDREDLREEIQAWRRRPVSHLAIDTMSAGRTTVEEHITAMRTAAHLLHA